jgi:hypothetical protein
MNVRLFSSFLILALAPLAVAEEDNPYKNVKVGDFAVYKMSTKIAGMSFDGTVTQTITGKTDKEATIKVIAKVLGQEVPREDKIDLTKPYDPTKAASLPPGTEAKIEKIKDGTEKIKVGDKTYDAKWESYNMKAKAQGQEFEATFKVWNSKDFPLYLLKMEMQAKISGMDMEMGMEVTESGNKPVEKTPEKK